MLFVPRLFSLHIIIKQHVNKKEAFPEYLTSSDVPGFLLLLFILLFLLSAQFSLLTFS